MYSAKREKVIEIIAANLGVDKSEMVMNDGLDEAGVDSITFVMIVVELENEFGIEFDDEQLLMEGFSTIESVVDYVMDICGKEDVTREDL